MGVEVLLMDEVRKTWDPQKVDSRRRVTLPDTLVKPGDWVQFQQLVSGYVLMAPVQLVEMGVGNDQH